MRKLFSVALVVATVGNHNVAEAAGVVVAGANRAEFKTLAPNAVCHLPSASVGFVRKSAAGQTIFESYTVAFLTKQIAFIDRKLPTATGAKLAALTRTKSKLEGLKEGYADNKKRCGALGKGKGSNSVGKTPSDDSSLTSGTSSSGGEFGGSAASLAPYREKLTRREVRYLLKKVAFGGSPELERIGLTQGLTPLVNALVDGVLSKAERDAEDADADYWSSEFYHYYTDDAKYKDVRIWTTSAASVGEIKRMISTREPFKEYMTLLLSAHFAVNLSAIGASYDKFGHYAIPLHVELLRRESTGNFRKLTLAMLADPAMNRWLNNKDNSKGKPNQNFARELLELFTLGATDRLRGGKPNYDERTIAAATAAVSGYEETDQMDPLGGNRVVNVAYNDQLHDDGAYPLFPESLNILRSFTPTEFVEFILKKHPASSRYVTDRFAGQLLYPGLPPKMVVTLAKLLLRNDYEMKPFLKAVLKSNAMFSKRAKGSCASSPIEHFVYLLRKFGPKELPHGKKEELEKTKGFFWHLGNALSSSGQRLFEPPSVFAWKGACNINRADGVSTGEGWYNSQRLFGRMRGCADVINNMNWIGVDFRKVIGLTDGMTEEMIVRKTAVYLGLESLSAKETAALADFLKLYIDEKSGKESMDPLKLADEWRWRKKLPRLICLLAERADLNER